MEQQEEEEGRAGRGLGIGLLEPNYPLTVGGPTNLKNTAQKYQIKTAHDCFIPTTARHEWESFCFSFGWEGKNQKKNPDVRVGIGNYKKPLP